MPESKQSKKPEHNLKGRCWCKAAVYLCCRCGLGNLCDVCHVHDEPRGECDCPPCLACDEKGGRK
jgi:hypothetical protein